MPGMSVTKKYLVKIYDQDNSTLRKTLLGERSADSHLKSDPSFHTRINGGQGELVLDLKAPFDDFDEGTTVDFLNVVKLYAVVKDDALKTQTTSLIYTGYISRYEPYVQQGGEEGVRVTCLGLASLLTKSYFSDGDFTVTRSSEDPTVTGKAIIDHFNSVFSGSLIGYDSSSVPATVGTSITYTFTDQKWFDCLTTVGKLAGTNWWWSIDRDGKYNFQAKPSTPTHTFVIGKNVESLVCPKDSEKVINDVYVRRSGGTETHYTDATSQSTYGTGSPATGKYTTVITDTSIPDATTADQRGNKELNDKKDAAVKATLVVNSNYDLESIRVGQTCKVTHFLRANTFFGSQNMLIVGLSYSPDRCALELESASGDFGLELAGFVG